MERYFFSILICCYNSESVIKNTLAHLAKLNCEGIEVEIILIDNNCTDNTVSLANELWRSYKVDIPLTVVKEDKPGLNFAREKGISCAKGTVVLFCDDDNWLDANYLQNAKKVFQKNSAVAVLGGFGMPETSTAFNKPDWFESIAYEYATGVQNDSNGEVEKNWVYGAGMLIKKEVFATLKNAGFKTFLTDRKGKSLASGGDVELCLAAKLLGYKIYYNDSLEFKHYITSERIDKNYLKRLALAKGKSFELIALYNLFIDAKPLSKLRENWILLFCLRFVKLLFFIIQKNIKLINNLKLQLNLKKQIGNLNEIVVKRNKIFESKDVLKGLMEYALNDKT